MKTYRLTPRTGVSPYANGTYGVCVGIGAAMVLADTVEELLEPVEGSGPDGAGAEGITSLHCWASASAAGEPSRKAKHKHDRIQLEKVGLKGVK